MDLNIIEALNEIRPSVYRVSMKLLTLQKRHHLDGVNIGHITAAFRSVGVANLQKGGRLNRQEVSQLLSRMFHSVSQEVGCHVTVESAEMTCSLMFEICRQSRSGHVSAASLQTALIALSADSIINKYAALVRLVANGSGSVSRSGLRSLLQDLCQVPVVVQEDGVFGGVELAVRSCFNGVLTSTTGEEHLLSWLQSEPRLLLWLPTLYRLHVSQNIRHTVRCHTCKTLPITGLRYRCMKCVNVHVCQNCFLTDRQTRKHKTSHPVIEFCTQPTWRESWSSLVQSARHALLPQRYAQREANRRRALMWVELEDTPGSALPPSDCSADTDISHHASSRPPSCSSGSTAQQTDEETPTQQEDPVLLTEVRNLQRDRWLMEQQLQAWKLTVQSDHSILEDRCAEIEVNMETMKEQNLLLQSKLTKALTRMENQQHTNDTLGVDTERITNEDTGTDEPQTPSTRMHQHISYEEEELEDHCPPIISQDGMEVESEMEESCVCEEEDYGRCSEEEDHGTFSAEGDYGRYSEEEDHGKRNAEEDHGRCSAEEVHGKHSEEEVYGRCSEEQLLQDTVETLRMMMETNRCTERWKGERKGAELLKASVQVGETISHLVDAVRTNKA